MESVTAEPKEAAAEGEVKPVEFLEGHEHAELFRWLYNLDDTRENCVEPMRLSPPNELCYPCWTMCRRHGGCPMLQIFSLKLITTNLRRPPASSIIEVYGFMAARDLLDPRRNYVFNRSRDDPLAIHHDQLHSGDPCLIYLSGPKRGVSQQAPVLLEYDMKIKRGQGEQDTTLIEGVAIFSNKTAGQAVTTRINGGEDHGAAAVEIRHARFPRALEATVQVRITELTNRKDYGRLDLSITGFVPKIPEDIMLFRGVVDEPRELNRFAIAVASGSYLILRFETRDAAGSRRFGKFAFRATPHGYTTHCRKFDFATVEVKVTWSNLITCPDDMM